MEHIKKNILEKIIPIRGFCISAPLPNELDEFIKFIEEELAPRFVNTLILRVDYNYQYKSHPELRNPLTLSENDVKRLVAVSKANNINVIPQINLLGHQSWDNHLLNLLKVYPEFDETPLIKMPEEYNWPNKDGLYCKSYCPLHPDVHEIVFDLVDEICDVFESNAFHAGMDEVFYIGESQCPRCSGKNKAELFAGEVHKIQSHLNIKGRKLWIWGDRLIDGKTTGIGEWEASYNNTFQAIDLIPKDVVICDWHYERPEKTSVYFAMKGLNVISCTWNVAEVAKQQMQDIIRYRSDSAPEMQRRFLGIMQTIWSDAGLFLDAFYGRITDNSLDSQIECFKVLFGKIQKIIEDCL